MRDLVELGYTVEHRELRACDYGAPTIRKRLFLIARCDGEPIVWPEATHGSGLLPYRTAAECIDWSIPMLSIFATKDEARAWGEAHGRHSPKRPLAEKTMARIARGVMRYVVEAAQPFIVSVAHGETSPSGAKRWGKGVRSLDEPLTTALAGGGSSALVAPFMVPRYGERPGQEPRTRSLEEPAPVVVPTGNGGNLVAAHVQRDFGNSVGQDAGDPLGTVTPGGGGKSAVVASYLARHWGGMVGKELTEPHPTILTKGAQDQLVAAHLSHSYTSNTGGGEGDLTKPAKTIMAGGTHAALVYSFLEHYTDPEKFNDIVGRRPDAGGYGHPGGPAKRRGVEVGRSGQHREGEADHPQASREQGEAGIFDGEGVLGREAVARVSPSPSLDGLERSDSGGAGPQPQGRKQDEQPPDEPRIGDQAGEHTSLTTDGTDTSAGLHREEVAGVGRSSQGAQEPGDNVPRDWGEDGRVPNKRLQGRAYAWLAKYYGVGVGQPLDQPAGTLTTKDRMGLVTVTIDGEPYTIMDIAMRMLQPRELFRAQGFPDSYRIEYGADGRKLTKTEQVRLVGNSVSPPQVEALVSANVPELVARDEVAA